MQPDEPRCGAETNASQDSPMRRGLKCDAHPYSECRNHAPKKCRARCFEYPQRLWTFQYYWLIGQKRSALRTPKPGTGFAGAKLSEIFRLRSCCSLLKKTGKACTIQNIHKLSG